MLKKRNICFQKKLSKDPILYYNKKKRSEKELRHLEWTMSYISSYLQSLVAPDNQHLRNMLTKGKSGRINDKT